MKKIDKFQFVKQTNKKPTYEMNRRSVLCLSYGLCRKMEFAKLNYALPAQPRTFTSLCFTISLMLARAGLRY